MKRRWYVVMLPFRDTIRLTDKAIERACLVSRLPLSNVDIFIPEQYKYVDGERSVMSKRMYEGYAFIYLPDDRAAMFLSAFEMRREMMFVLKVVVRRKIDDKMIEVRIPAEVSVEDISTIRRQCNWEVEQERELVLFRVGDHVHVLQGIFAGFDGVVKYVDRLDREILVQTFFLGTDVTIHVDRDDLQCTEERTNAKAIN